MLGSLKNVAKVPDLRKKILFTLFIIGLYRVGSFVPVPGVSFDAIQELSRSVDDSTGGILSFLQVFSGQALSQFSVFGLGIMPYITASIIIQLLTVVIPKLSQWRDEGVTGQRRITQTTRYLTLVLAIIQATGITVTLHNNPDALGIQTTTPLLAEFDIPHVLLVVLTMTAGAALVMWLGELITQRGIGQGMSILIFANVVSGMPTAFESIRLARGNFAFAIIVAISLGLLVAIVFIEQCQRRIPVQFAKRIIGRKQYGGQSTYIPLKVNASGVVPILFASAVLQFPIMIATVLPGGIQTWVNDNLADARKLAYIFGFGFLVIGFAYFYTRVTFDPVKQADVLKKQGGYVPGIRPGPATEMHFTKILNRITLPGALYLALVALIPSIALAVWGIKNYPFAGTTILIAVGVALDTMRQVDSQLTMRNYEGFLK